MIFLDFSQLMLVANPLNIVLEYSKVTSNCSVNSIPSPTGFSWYKDSVIVNNMVERTFVIDSIKKEQSGLYTCKVSHWLGKKEANIILTVQCQFERNSKNCYNLLLYV